MSEKIVKGVVTAMDSTAVQGVVVKAYDLDMRNEQLLGEAVSDRDGQYVIKYKSKQYARAEKTGADVLVRVYSRKKKLIHEPAFEDIVFNAPAKVKINIRLTVAVPEESDEFTRLIKETKPLIGDVALRDLKENDDHQDISFLSRECELDAKRLDYLVIAHRLNKISKVIPEFFYALLRKDTLLKSNFSSLFDMRFQVDLNSDDIEVLYDIALVDTKQITTDIKAARKEKIIPSIKRKDLEKIFKILSKYISKAEKHQKEERPKKLVKLISTFAHKEKIEQINKVVNESKQDYRKFFDYLVSTDVFKSVEDEQEAKASVEIAELFGFDTVAVNTIKEFASINNTDDIKKLVKVGRSGWKKLINKSSDKIKNAGFKLSAKLVELHASSIAKKIEVKYPALAFIENLKSDSESNLEAHNEMISFFTEQEEFDLKKSNVDLYFKKKKINRNENKVLVKELKDVQRVFKLAPDYGKATSLLDQNIHSAHSIVGTGRHRFINEIAPKAKIEVREAEEIFARAEGVHTASMMIVGELQDTLRSAEIGASKIDSLAAKLKAVSEDFPNMKSLFKMTDLCACEHCRSVYSPAAYLVELFEYLDKRSVVDLTTNPVTTGYLAKDVLLERRPDLGYLDLNCENAMTPVPYIDLVCEILEEQVEPDPGIDFTGTIVEGTIPAALIALLNDNNIPVTTQGFIQAKDVNGDFILRDEKAVCKIINVAANAWKVIRLRQTHAKAQELSAAPEYVNNAAYAKLEASKYAFKLPFSLHHTVATAYFERFDIKRSALMRELEIGAVPAAFEIGAEKLDITDHERKLIVDVDTVNQNDYWNVNAADVIGDMEVVNTFLGKTGLRYEELQEFLQLKFINPDGTLFIRHIDETCDTSEKVIDSLDVDALDRMHRFLRLLNNTGWSKELINEVVVQNNLGASNLDNNCIEIMAQFMEIQQATGIKTEELAGCYGDIPHTEIRDSDYQPLYNNIFLNKAANGFIDEKLNLDNIGVGDLITNYKNSISLCLQITEQDFDVLLNLLPDTLLTFSNLSALYAGSLLSRRLGITINDYMLYRELTTLDLFDSPTTTVDFIKRFEVAKSSPQSISDVKFLLTHDADNLTEREIKDDKVIEILGALRSSYVAANEANLSPYSDELKADEQKAALKNLLLRIPAITEEIANGFMRMVDNEWVAPPVASDYIDDHLGPVLNDVTLIKAAQAALQAALVTDLVDIENKRKDLIKELLNKISDNLYITDKADILTTQISESFQVDSDIAMAVMEQVLVKQLAPGNIHAGIYLTDDKLIDVTGFPVIDQMGYPDQFATLKLCHKLFSAIETIEISSDDIRWLLEYASTFNWFEMDSIPYEAGQTSIDYLKWETFVKALSLLKSLTAVVNPADIEKPITFKSVMDFLLPKDGNPFGATRDELLNDLAILYSYDRDLLDEIDIYFNYSNPDISKYRDPETWVKISSVMEYLRKMGVTVAQAKAFIKPVLTATDTDSLRMALKARYDENLWLTTMGEIMDKIRPQKRDALVTYLLSELADIDDANDLFDYFLVDVEMEACLPSSRIVQAHGVIQLFVQRSLMGLEPSAAADVKNDKSWDQWKWMKNYRVWEANRKVFLYPENWIEPELLDDKSYIFSELENELLQNEVNEFTTEDALIRYLEKLDEISFLEVVATYYQTDIYTMHVFARTKGGDPAQYYYRRFEKERYWTPWELVSLDITTNQLLAFVRNDRLHLAWPVFSEEANPDQDVTVPAVSGSASTTSMDKPERRLKIQLAISQYANNQWKPKKISQDAITTPEYFTTNDADLDRDNYNLHYGELLDQILVFHSQTSGNNESHYSDGIFNIAGCKGYPELLSTAQTYLPDPLPDIKDSELNAQRYWELNQDDPDDLAIRNMMTLLLMVVRLNKTPGNFRITHPHQLTIIDLIGLILQMIALYLSGAAGYYSNSTVGYRKDRWLKLPLGTLMPYFFEDSDHAYTIIPGFYGTELNDEGEEIEVKRTFSDVHKLILDAIALFSKYIAKLNKQPTPTLLELAIELKADPDYLQLKEDINGYKGLLPKEQFKNLYHPLICHLRKTLYSDGVPALMDRDTQLFVNTQFNFDTHYDPAWIVAEPYPIEDVDFTSDGSYSGYNWELFFHAPLMIAMRLSKNQKFEEAMTWFHYIFNPTGTLEGDAPQKYWVTKPFYQALDKDYIAQRIDTLLYKIADPTTPERNELEFAIDQWREKPFRPHVIARTRPMAYQKTVLIKYIQNLLDWGDYQFRQGSMESIPQATQLYILADKLLGEKPRIVPPAIKVPYQNYYQIETSLDAFGNALLEIENLIPDLSVLPQGGDELPPPPATLSSLYFCIPQNDKMLEYWDTVADRLFKIRNCQDINGVPREIALFAPPIDPGMLVKAAAAGLDISSIIAGLNAPLPYYRFNVFAQKTSELVAEVRSLGSSLLQALEKKDGEALALLRSEHEIKLLKAVRTMKEQQVEEAKEQIEVLNRTRAVTEERNRYYNEIEKINNKEQLNLDKLSESQDFQVASQIVQATGGILGLIPDFSIGGHGAGGSPAFHATIGGSFFAEAANAAASVLNILASIASYEAGRAATLGSYDRRYDDWQLQERTSSLEMEQIDQQIVAAEIRQTISETDLSNQDLQIDNSEKMDDFMRSKYTNKELYEWQITQITSVYFRSYQLAYDTAKKAERCYQHELGSTETFLEYGYWDNLKKGLQSADHLLNDLKRMEVSYLEENKREYELRKNVSLVLLDPFALIRLKATGECDFNIPEALYDMDHAGQYFRRIKSISISIPCVAGPHTSVSAKLSQVSNKYRKNTAKAQGAANPKEEYEEVVGNDIRFIYNVGSIQSLATSNAQNDSGLFELNFRDERYLPFEGSGAIGSWHLELPDPEKVHLFDYATITDVIMHISYTAREGGSTLKALAEDTLTDKFNEITQELSKTGLHLAINLKHERANDWHKLKTDGLVNMTLAKSMLPYMVQSLNVSIDTVTFIAEVDGNPATYTIELDASDLLLNRNDEWKLCLGDDSSISLDTAFDLSVDGAAIDDLQNLMIIVKYVFS